MAGAAAVVALMAGQGLLNAQANGNVERVCGLRIAAALAGDPRPNVDQPQADLVAAELESSHFEELFARFVNTRFNRGLAMSAEEDAVYYTVRHVLQNNLPWSQLYLGEFGWEGPQGYPRITADPNGVGYFTAPAWVRRYSGNDLDGFMLFAAYRVVQNTTGVVLVPSPFNADANSNLAGREREECRYCHLDSPLALDRIARFFPTRTGFGNRMMLTPPQNTPATLAGDHTVNNLKSLLQVMLQTDDYKFWTCRMVFEFTYGRPESACEAPIFDRCVDALVATDDIRQAITAVVADPSFCVTEAP